MRVWYLASEKEQKQYMAVQQLSSTPKILPIGDEHTQADGDIVWIHHMDDEPSWLRDPVLHPCSLPTAKPSQSEWTCPFHDYEVCRCHLELREYGQDKSIFRSGETSSRRWAVNGRAPILKKSTGYSRMASVFKDYSNLGVGLEMTEEQLQVENDWRKDKFYQTDIDKKIIPIG